MQFFVFPTLHFRFPNPHFTVAFLFILILGVGALGVQAAIPLAEHPRPDFQRPDWINLNGPREFRFDAEDKGEKERWFASAAAGYPERIRVPLSWGAPLSGFEDRADIGWYDRSIRAPEEWNGKRLFLVIGACDWAHHGLAEWPSPKDPPWRLHPI